MERTSEEVRRFSACAGDWFRAIEKTAEPERRLYPGALALLTSALAFVVARRQKAKLMMLKRFC